MSYTRQMLDSYQGSLGVDVALLAAAIEAMSDCAQACIATLARTLANRTRPGWSQVHPALAEMRRCRRRHQLPGGCPQVTSTAGSAPRHGGWGFLDRPLTGKRGSPAPRYLSARWTLARRVAGWAGPNGRSVSALVSAKRDSARFTSPFAA